MYELLPGGGSMNNLNDCSSPCGTVAVSLPLADTGRAPILPWLARQLDLHPSRLEWLESDAADEDIPRGDTLLAFLLWWDDDAPVKTPQELGYPLSRFFSGRGIVSMRTKC